MPGRVAREQIDEFWRNGVVCLRAVIDPAAVAAMAEAFDDATTTTLARGFAAGTDHWVEDARFAEWAIRSPLPEIAAALLRSEAVYLYEDSVLVKEPHSDAPTRLHQDLSYFNVDGDQIVTTWTPLDPVNDSSGATRYVVGSHRRAPLFRPNLFVSTEPIPGTHGPVLLDDDPSLADATIVSFDVEPGDVIAHHTRTIHGAFANRSDRRRRAISVRYCGDDARHLDRGFSLKPWAGEVADGDRLGHPGCPRVWPPQLAPGTRRT